MNDNRWWCFWDVAQWREWRHRRGPWTEYKTTSKGLDARISHDSNELAAAGPALARVNRQRRWAGDLTPTEVPVKIGRNETGPGAVPGVNRS